MSTFPQAKHSNVKKRLAGVLAVTCLVGAVGSFALFTDRAQSKATMEAGTLDLTLSQTWIADNAEVITEYAPGDILNLDYTLTNTGSLSTDIRETFVIVSNKVIDDDFEIYAFEDVEQDPASGLWAPKAGKAPIEVRSTEAYGTGTKITYAIPELTVDGSEETGDATESTHGSTIAGNKKTGDYVLLFAADAANSIQGTELTVEYVAQGLQHRNTGNDTWEDAKVITESITIGGVATDVVPELN